MKLGNPMPVAPGLALCEVLRPKLRDFDTDEVGHLVDQMLWRHGELGEKTAPKTVAEVNAVIGIYGAMRVEAKLWKQVKKELLRTLKNPKPIEYQEE